MFDSPLTTMLYLVFSLKLEKRRWYEGSLWTFDQSKQPDNVHVYNLVQVI